MVRKPVFTLDLSEFDRAIDTVAGEMEKTTPQRIVEEVGKKILDRSKQLAPTDTGRLRDSHVFEVQERGGAVVGTVFVTADYAFFVHEDLEATHDDGEAKFLEKAFRQNRRFLSESMKRRVAEAAAKGGF